MTSAMDLSREDDRIFLDAIRGHCNLLLDRVGYISGNVSRATQKADQHQTWTNKRGLGKWNGTSCLILSVENASSMGLKPKA